MAEYSAIFVYLQLMKSESIILFDGVCSLCNALVIFIIKHDPACRYKFVSLQSDIGINILRQHHIECVNSFILIENDKSYSKSTAALKIAKRLSGLVKLLYVFIVIPSFVRDIFYSVVAHNRYRWFGKSEKCLLPTTENLDRFII